MARRLEADGVDVAEAVERSRYLALDAKETLAAFMVDGMPDPALFEEVIGKRVRQAREAARDENLRLVAFGEMVAILMLNGQPEAALALERLWTKLAKTYSFSLRCAYPMEQFNQYARKELFMKVCDEHSAVIPAEEYVMLSTEDERLRSIAELQQKAGALEAELTLHRSEEQLRLLVESVQDYAIFLLDPQGRVSTWNLGAQRIKGYQASEIIGKHFSVFYPEEDLARENLKWNWRSPQPWAASRTKAGASAKTVRDFGPTSSLPPCATPPENSGVLAKSPAMLPRKCSRSKLFGKPTRTCAKKSPGGPKSKISCRSPSARCADCPVISFACRMKSAGAWAASCTIALANTWPL